MGEGRGVVARGRGGSGRMGEVRGFARGM